ncbi:WecB/TagA/CpsF family glycosyltransferase, partial [Enterococcus faecium]|uniref:WecB/TagA/CpsF family glycosyltransferase n=1 Tax=Enterococcus faecium TaxID=1352 RepID=UPI0023B297E5
MEETLDRIDRLICNGTKTQHVVINASKINMMAKDKMLRQIVNSSPIINADGQSIVWAAKFLGFSVPQRVTGIDVFERLVALSEAKNYSIYYFGATQQIVEKVVQIHSEKYPNLKINGFRSGYFKENESIDIVKEINNCKPDILIVALPSPQKEYWINRYKDKLDVLFIMGVGGSFDVIAGKVMRAPIWLQKMGLEWLYRLIQEPRKMFKRYLIGNIIFT